MASFYFWLSTIGALASIAGAVWAFVQARRATRAASKAETVKDQLIEHRQIAEIAQVYHETRRILAKVSAIGPSSVASTARGINCASIAREVEEYARLINEQSTHFTDFLENRARDLSQSLRPEIEALAEATTFEARKEAGVRIYYAINDFMPLVKSISDRRQERVRVT